MGRKDSILKRKGIQPFILAFHSEARKMIFILDFRVFKNVRLCEKPFTIVFVDIVVHIQSQLHPLLKWKETFQAISVFK